MRVKSVLKWFALSLVLCGTAWGADFSVKSFGPQGEVSGKPEIKVVFSSPVAEKALLGKVLPADQVPLIFRPDLRGSCTWDSPDTLVFVPERALSQATEYQVSMKPLRDLSGRLLAGPQSFRFNTSPLKLKGVRQVEVSPYREVTLELEFSLPVPPQRLLGFISATSDGRALRLIPQGEAPGTKISVRTEYVPGETISLSVEKGLASDLGPLGLTEGRNVDISLSNSLSITGGYAESRPEGQGRINLYTSRSIDPGEVKGFVTVLPERPFRVEPIYGGFALVGDFTPRDRYTVKVKKGLGGKEGLESDQVRSFVIPDMDRSVQFPVYGTFLTPLDRPRIPVETVNLDRVEISGWRLYANNVALVVGALDSGSEPPKTLSRGLGSKVFDVDNRLNRGVRGALDLEDFLGDKKGVFLLEVSDGQGGWEIARQMVTLTDIGISARLWDRSMLVWVNGLSDGGALPDCSVTVYSSSNQILARGTTDKDGLWSFSDQKGWDPQLRPAVVTVEKGDDLSFLVLTGDKFADSGVDVSGASWISSYQAECLLPRGIFRPGETVDIETIVRAPRMGLPGEFPFMWRVVGPSDSEVIRGSQPLSPLGTAATSFALPVESPTGRYRFEVSVPGGDGPLGSTSFLVEDFTPPRIELDLTSAKDLLSVGDDVDLSFKASYLFGAPSPGLPWEMQVFASPRRFSSKVFTGYSFGDEEVSPNVFSDYVGSGNLDDQGEGAMTWTVPDHWRAPSMVDLTLSIQAMEPGGRWVSRFITLPCALSARQIGIRSPEGDVLPGKAAPFKVAAVTAEDKPLSVSLSWELFSVFDRYVMVREDGRTRMRWQEEKVSVTGGSISVKDGKGDLSVTPDQEGRYLLVLSDGEGASGSVRFDSWRPWDGSSKAASMPDRIELSLDGNSLAYVAPFPGRALFTLEADGLVEARVIPSVDRSGKVAFDPKDSLWPNGWCSLQVIRPVSDKGNWGPHRAIGAIAVPMDNGSLKADVRLDLADSVEPGSTLHVKASVADGKGKPMSGQLWLAVVDRGILGLTDHQLPDPWKSFTAQRRLGSRASDLYDELIPIESRETPLLHPAGGAGAAMMALNLSPLKSRGFKVLSMVQSDLEVKEGLAEGYFELPEFSGGATVMAVFVGSGLGSASASVSIAREITVDPGVPSVLAPGDSVKVPLSVISASSRDVDLSLEVQSSGQWTYQGNSPVSVKVPAGGTIVLDLPLKAQDLGGYGELKVRATGPGLDFVVERETVIRPAMPRITLSDSGISDPGVTRFDERGSWFPGTAIWNLYLSGSPKADLFPAVSFLRGYPYRCLEQTVSSTWPLVVMADMVKSMESLSQDDLNRLLVENIVRLQALQLYDGSFVSWPNGASDRWGSIYAAHLLALVDPSLIPEGMAMRTGNFLRAFLADSSEDTQSLSQKAYGAYVISLSGQPPLGWMEWLSDKVGEMDEAGRSFLAGAYGLAGKKDQAKALFGRAVTVGDDPYRSPMRDQAIRLLALDGIAPDGPEQALIAGELSRSLNASPLSTQEAGFAVLALGRYLSRADVKPFSAVVSDGESSFSLSTGDERILSADVYRSWELKNQGPGRVVWSRTVSGVPLDAQPQIDQGIKVRRVLTDREGNELNPSKPLELGQEVTVRITLTPTGPLSNPVVVDVLPGCFEVWNPALEPGEESITARREVRFDRVLFFPDLVEQEVSMGYRCRVIARGEFALPPVAAEAMYNPGVRSLNGGGRITVK